MRKLFQGGLAAGAALLACAPAGAGVSYVDQARGVEAAIGVGTVPNPPDPTLIFAKDSRTADGFGTFDETLTLDYTDPGDGDPNTVVAAQTSTLGDDGFSATGRVSVAGDDRGSGRSLFRVTFDVDEETDYALTVGTRFSTFDAGGTENRDLVTFRFARLGDGGAETVLGEDSLTIEDASTGDPAFDFATAGRLEAGRYAVDLDLTARNPAGQTEDGAFDLTFETSDDDGGGETPIPLPPAAWAGLGTFACYGASRLLGRRLRRA